MKPRLLYLLGAALLVSLGLNVFLGGVMIGRWAEHGFAHSGGSPRFIREAALKALNPAARAIVDDLRDRHQAQMRDKFRAVRQATRALEAQLQADEIDRAALDAAQADLSDRWAEARAEMARGMTELALALPPDARKLYFKAVGKRPWAGHHPANWADSPPPPRP